MLLNVCYIILSFLPASVLCLFEMCNHNVEMKEHDKLYINSPYYPAKYPLGSSCRYVIKAPEDYKLKFTCDINLKVSPSAIRCQDDGFYFNPEGNEILTESEYFCGRGKMQRKSFLNQAVLSYISTPQNKRILNNFTTINDEDVQENKVEKMQIKTENHQQEIRRTNKKRTTCKALKENLLTTENTTKSTTTTRTAPIVIFSNLSNFFTQSFSLTTSTPTSSALAETNTIVKHNMDTNKKVSNSFAYVVTLLSNKSNTGDFATTTNITSKPVTAPAAKNSTTSRPTSVLDFREHLPVSTWLNRSIATHKISTKRVGQVIANQDYISGTQSATASNSTPITPFTANIRSRQAGGSFSCLVEVFQPECECGWSSTVKIAGASGVAGINEFPSMAGIMTIKNQKIFCGATIIHHRYLLSAAHCYITPESNTPEYLTAVVGEQDVSMVLDSVYTRQYDLIKIILHEHFQATSVKLNYDIALLKTRYSIDWSRSVGPVCMPFYALKDVRNPTPYAGQWVETAGWGTTSFGGQQSSLLLKTSLNVVSSSACQTVTETLPFGTFCTYTPERDTCQYDSGGALYVRAERLYAVGIVSYGYACATKKPAINTRISAYLNWITNNTPDAKYCLK